MLTFRRGLVPACLTLGVLLSALPVLADTPAAPSVSASAPQMIRLQNVVPGDIVKMMHWELASNLPAGVTQIVSVPLQNALLVTGTPGGLAQVRKIVTLADMEPRPVQIKVALARVSEADREASGIKLKLYATGAPAVQFLSALIKQGKVIQQCVVTTSSGVKGAMNVEAGPADHSAIMVVPRVNANNSVTLTLHVDNTEGAVTQEISLFRTLKSGDTLVYVLPPAVPGGESFLCFATPTIK